MLIMGSTTRSLIHPESGVGGEGQSLEYGAGSILQRLRQMRLQHPLTPRQIRNRAAELQHVILLSTSGLLREAKPTCWMARSFDARHIKKNANLTL
jgi:hypothetical protein